MEALLARIRHVRVAPPASPAQPGGLAACEVAVGWADTYLAPAPQFALSLSVRRRRAVLAVAGELSGETAAHFLDAVARAVAAGARSVVVHLGGAEVVDDGGLSAVAVAALELENRRGELVLKAPRSQTLTRLAVSGLDRTVPIC